MEGDHKSENKKEKERIAKKNALAKASKLKEANDKMKATSKQFKEKEKGFRSTIKSQKDELAALRKFASNAFLYGGL